MKKKTLLLSTLASSILVAGMAFPSANATTSSNLQGKISANYPTKDEHSVVVQLMDGETSLKKSDIEAFINAKYAEKNLPVKFANVAPVNSDGTVGTGATVTLTDDTELTLVLYGDVNGDGIISVDKDAQKIFEYSLGSATLSPAEKLAADVVLSGSNGDIFDAQRVFEYAFYQKEFADKVGVSNFAENFDEVSEILPETLAPEIVSFEVASTGNGKITVKLSKPVTEPRFYLNGKLINGSSLGVNTYKITANKDDLLLDKENTLKVSDLSNTFEETKTFTYRKLVAPTVVTIAPKTSVNDQGYVNANNVTNATVLVQLRQNAVPLTLEVTITDTPTDDSEPTVITLPQEISGDATEVKFEGKDLSSLRDGKLTMTAKLTDDQGNIAQISNNTVMKMSNKPIVKYSSVTRTDATKATVATIKSSSTDVLYYLVKNYGEEAPSVDDVITSGTKVPTGTSITATIENGEEQKAYVVYVVAETLAGTKSEDVLAVNIPKTTATKIAKPDATTIKKKTGTSATFVWNYDETTPGLVGYKVILQKKNNNSKFVDFDEKTINEGETREVNFFDEMKKEAGDYKVEVIALADNVDYTNSDKSVGTEEVKVSDVTTGVTTSFDTNTKSLLKWTVTD